MLTAADAPVSAKMSDGLIWSALITVAMICVSAM